MIMTNLFTAGILLLTLFTFAASKEAHLVLLKDPGEALCLGGSPPGYYFREGDSLERHKFNSFCLQ